MPWSPLHAQLHTTLRQRKLLHEGDRLLIAVSGGQDSLCLAQLALDLQPKWHWTIAIAHCDHRWREDSAANAAAVAEMAQQWHCPYFQAVAPEPLSSEAAARTWRYQALEAIAQAQDYPHLLTGHTQSDRAETLLYNLIRGAGAEGLQALTWQRSLSPHLTLTRPLLELSRQQTGQFCQTRQLPVWWDSSNDDPTYARNRLRLDVLPYLEQQFHPQVSANLAQTAELLQADVAYLNQQAETLLEQVLGYGDQALHRKHLKEAPLALQRRALRLFLKQHLTRDPSFAHVEKLQHLISAPNRSQSDPFPGGAIARVVHPWIHWIRPNGP
ncbi:tRNA lysidine(34) synthetase TilS [Phormidium yuhuli AB48]|uniref:tRNA(Ile)-lysidine synthase n=1 Tax=Phormidium yuhuli AB48 TaxID=2940671 RepID=A0ABY5AN59_9CYAN|nr:tRNA lysidine(34) synthetase TilS [Phormidium yuhuli]USR90617.1 tRNA lysidine(34) synthetase TilS [Phormidium yuhuli AB48]